MTSTSFIIGTGFMKCIPMTLSGLEVDSAMVLIDIEDVLLARMADGLQIASSLLKVLVFRSNTSGMASTTRSHSARSPRSSDVFILSRASSEVSGPTFPWRPSWSKRT